MKGRNWLPVIVVCALLLPGLAPAREPVQAKLEQSAAPENLYSLGLDSRNDYVGSDAALTDQGPFAAAARVNTTAASDCDDARYYPTIHSGDIDGDGVDELLARTPSGMEAWRFHDTIRTWLRLADRGPFSDLHGWHYAWYYATIHSADINGDGVDELLGRGVDGMEVYSFNGAGWDMLAGSGPFSNADGWVEEKYYATIHSADIDGDGEAELLGRWEDGMQAYDFNGTNWDPLASGGPFADADGWGDAEYYATIHSADIHGDGVDELMARWEDGMQAWRFNTTSKTWVQVASGGPWSDADGWDEAKYYATIHSADIDGDGEAELLGRWEDGMQAYRFNGAGWDLLADAGLFSDTYGWNLEMYYATIHSADIDGDGEAELLGRWEYGMQASNFNGTNWVWLAGDGPFALAARDGNHGGYYYEGPYHWMGYWNPDWMEGIPDDRRLSELSIPGTHDSGATFPYLPATPFVAEGYWLPVTQGLFVSQQLASGIRLLDIRLQIDSGELVVFHGMTNQFMTFDQVLHSVVNFLEHNPSETVLMNVQENTGCVWFCNVNASFIDLVNEYLDETYDDGTPYRNWVWEPTSVNPELGEVGSEQGVRGKIVILDKFSVTFGEKVDHGPANDVGRYSSLALDSQGNPHISYHDTTNGILKYARWISPTWDIQPVDGAIGVVVGLYTSLALDSQGNPHISYFDETNGILKYARSTGSGWDIQVVDGAPGVVVGLHSSLALDGNDVPHISYYDATNGDLKYASWTGSDWLPASVDSGGDVGQYTSLALDGSDVPHMSYYDVDNGDLKYAYWAGSDWWFASVDGDGDVGRYTSLALDAAGNPHISYYDVDNGDLKYAYRWGSGTWDWWFAPVDGDENVGLFTSLALDSQGYPHISYHDGTNVRLKYERWTGSGWDAQPVDGGIDGNNRVVVGGYTSLALDDNDQPHISYYDVSNGDLKYADHSDLCGEGVPITTDYGLKSGAPCSLGQSVWQLEDPAALRDVKWPAVEAHFQAADEGELDKYYDNGLNAVDKDAPKGGYDCVLPYFVASGHDFTPGDRLLMSNIYTSGDHKPTGDTCCAGIDCASDYYPWPYGNCSDGECEVYYTGTNELATLYLWNHPPEGQPRRWGLIWTDFPGPKLLDAIIGANLLAPAAPTLLAPPDGGSTCDTTPAFQWSVRSGAESYHIQVDDNEDFSSTLIDTTTPDASYTPDAALLLGTYYWRVIALSHYGDSDWSPLGQFAVVSTLPAPGLSSPPEGRSTCGRHPTFEWSPVSGSYRIQVADDEDFSSPLIDTTTLEARYRPDSILPSGTYYWRVMALADCGDSGWSPEWQFVHMGCLYLPLVGREY